MTACVCDGPCCCWYCCDCPCDKCEDNRHEPQAITSSVVQQRMLGLGVIDTITVECHVVAPTTMTRDIVNDFAWTALVSTRAAWWVESEVS